MRTDLTLLGRNYCHLCHDMEQAVRPIAEEYGVNVELVDVDQHPELEARYDELVPVLLWGDEELCHYFLDEARVRAVLSQIR